MKKWIVMLFVVLIFAAATIIYSTSTLSLDRATATFSVYEDQKGMNTLKVEAPYGYDVIRYTVVPRWPPNEQKPFKLGGRGISNDPIGLFDDVTVHASYFPSQGTVEVIPVEKHVRISSDLNVAATAEIPANKDILLRCGTYVFVTKDRSAFDKLESIVPKWSFQESPDSTNEDGAGLDIPREWKPSHPQNGTTVSAVVRVVGVVEKPFPDPKSGKQVFQSKALVLQPDPAGKKLVPSRVWVYPFCSTPLRKDADVRVTGELSISEGQVKGGKYPATTRVSVSKTTNQD